MILYHYDDLFKKINPKCKNAVALRLLNTYPAVFVNTSTYKVVQCSLPTYLETPVDEFARKLCLG